MERNSLDKPYRFAADRPPGQSLGLRAQESAYSQHPSGQGFFQLSRMAGPGPCRFGVINCDNIPTLEQDAITGADKFREEVETGKIKPSINVTELSR